MSVLYLHQLHGISATGEEWITGLHSIDPSNSVIGSHDVWLSAIGELWAPGSVGNAGWASVVTSSVTTTKATTYTLLAGTTRKVGKIETPSDLSGSGTGSTISPAVAAMVLLDTLGEPGNRSGRMYLPGPASDFWDNGRIEATTFALLGTCVSKALLAMYAGGLHPCTIQADTSQVNEITDIRPSNKAAVRKSRDDAPPVYGNVHIFP